MKPSPLSSHHRSNVFSRGQIISLHCARKKWDKYEAIMEGLYHHYVYKSWAAETVSTDEYSVPKSDFEKEIIAEV